MNNVSETCWMVLPVVNSKKWVGLSPYPELAANKILPFGKSAAGASASVQFVVPSLPHTAGMFGPARHVPAAVS